MKPKTRVYTHPHTLSILRMPSGTTWLTTDDDINLFLDELPKDLSQRIIDAVEPNDQREAIVNAVLHAAMKLVGEKSEKWRAGEGADLAAALSKLHGSVTGLSADYYNFKAAPQ